MSDSSNLAIGAGVGAAAGAGTGALVAKNVFKNNYGAYVKDYVQKDTFVLAKNKQSVQQFLQNANKNQIFKDAAQKMKEFNENAAPIIKKHLNIEWIGGLAAAGAAIGLATAAIINKVKANKEQNTEKAE